jgi:copper chaperone CopZ
MHQTDHCHIEPVQKPLDSRALERADVVYLAVSGMGCPRCAMRVNNSLLKLEGVLLSEVILENGIAAVAYDPGRVTPTDLVRAVSDAGNDGRHHYAARVFLQVSAREAVRQPSAIPTTYE